MIKKYTVDTRDKETGLMVSTEVFTTPEDAALRAEDKAKSVPDCYFVETGVCFE